MKTKKAKVNKVYREMQKATEKYVVNVGGAGSAKSYSHCQFFILDRLLKRKDYQFIVLRKTRQSNKLSIYKDFIDLLKLYGIYNEKNHNKSDMIYNVPENNAFVQFGGMDNRERLKSTQWHDIWLEEANEFVKEDFTFLKTRLYRGKVTGGHPSRLWMTLNPVECWIHDLEGSDNMVFIYSTYKDNIFCNEDYEQIMENLKDEDEDYYNIYTLGKWSVPRDIIYNPLVSLNQFPDKFEEVVYGVDFGFNNPSTLIQANLLDREFYMKEMIHQTRLTNGNLIDLIKQKIPYEHLVKGYPIYCDNAEPARIEEGQAAGLKMIPADKSVKDGIEFCRRFKYYSLESNVSLNKEWKAYKWKADRDGNVLDEPVKFKDHCFVGNTKILTFNGQVNIKDIKKGDLIYTPQGFKKVLIKHVIDNDSVFEYKICKNKIVCTKDHKVFTNRGYKEIQALTHEDTFCIVDSKEYKEYLLCKEKLMKSSTKVLNLDVILIIKGILNIISLMQDTLNQAFIVYIDTNMNVRLGKFLKGIMYIIKTGIVSIMKLAILFCLHQKNILVNMLKSGHQRIKNILKNTWMKLETKLNNGMCQKKEKSGIANMQLNTNLDNIEAKKENAQFVKKNINHALLGKDFVAIFAKINIDANKGLMMLLENVQDAEKNLKQTNIKKQSFVAEGAVKNFTGKLYDLTIEDTHCYFANNILVHNCMDAMRYAIYTHFKKLIQAERRITSSKQKFKSHSLLREGF